MRRPGSGPVRGAGSRRGILRRGAARNSHRLRPFQDLGTAGKRGRQPSSYAVLAPGQAPVLPSRRDRPPGIATSREARRRPRVSRPRVYQRATGGNPASASLRIIPEMSGNCPMPGPVLSAHERPARSAALNTMIPVNSVVDEIPARPDPESAEWIRVLAVAGPRREAALARLHEMLLRIAQREARRRGPRLLIGGPELEDLAYQAAADALMAITGKLGQFRGESRFTTWAYRFVILEVSAELGLHFLRRPDLRLEAEVL